MDTLEIYNGRITKLKGASPSEDLYYVMVTFDITNKKKYAWLIKVLKGFCNRIQYSVFEAYLNSSQIRELMSALERIMKNEKLFYPRDRIRVYRISGNCELTVFGEYIDNVPERDVFI